MSELLLWRIESILERFPVSRRHLQNLRHQGEFPEPSKVIGRVPFWHKDVIDQWARGEWKPETRPGQKARAAAAK